MPIKNTANGNIVKTRKIPFTPGWRVKITIPQVLSYGNNHEGYGVIYFDEKLGDTGSYYILLSPNRTGRHRIGKHSLITGKVTKIYPIRDDFFVLISPLGIFVIDSSIGKLWTIHQKEISTDLLAVAYVDKGKKEFYYITGEASNNTKSNNRLYRCDVTGDPVVQLVVAEIPQWAKDHYKIVNQRFNTGSNSGYLCFDKDEQGNFIYDRTLLYIQHYADFTGLDCTGWIDPSLGKTIVGNNSINYVHIDNGIFSSAIIMDYVRTNHPATGNLIDLGTLKGNNGYFPADIVDNIKASSQVVRCFQPVRRQSMLSERSSKTKDHALDV